MNFSKTVLLNEKKSKFYGYLLENTSVLEINEALLELKKEHKKATHICYAYLISSPFSAKAVDDGEPSGTAGRPILSVIEKSERKDVCIFVVRYFGGVKLGAGGLLRVYTKVAGSLLK